ncbi:MAG TPA: tetratricopeptide repeat protein [Candidatus Acidoferrales bacterium]|nr:tetratricopeptide repeat protein [Candidatus Acidoferrales bacterium]
MTQTTKTRRETLEGFVRNSPRDAFARYGLAVECANLGDNAAAQEHFRQLLADNPGYVAGYYQFGQLLARLGESADARRILSAGVAAAQKAGDIHARDEMQAALAALP